MSKLETNQVDPATGTTLTLGTSGDTITIPSGVTIANSGTATGFGETNTPYFQAYRGSSTQSISAGSWTKVQINTEIVDSANAYDNSTNYRFTPQTAGKYYIYGKLSFDDTNIAANTDEHMAKVYKNGSQESVYYKFATGNDNYLVFAEVLDLDGDDYIEIYAKINNSNGGRVVRGASANQKYTTFGAFRITGV